MPIPVVIISPICKVFIELCYNNISVNYNRWGVVDLYQCVGGGTEGRYYLIVCFFLFVLLSFGLLCPVSFLTE